MIYCEDPREDWKVFWTLNFLNARHGTDFGFRSYQLAQRIGLRQEWHELPSGEEFLAFQLPPSS